MEFLLKLHEWTGLDNKLIRLYHEKLLTGAISPTIEMTDAAMFLHIRSVDGSEGWILTMILELRRRRIGEYSHTLSDQEKNDIKTYRSGVEHNFASLKRFLAIQVKRTKLLKTFNCYLQLANSPSAKFAKIMAAHLSYFQ